MPSAFSPFLVYPGTRNSLSGLIGLLLLGTPLSSLAQSDGESFSRELAGELMSDRCETCHNDYDYAGNWSMEEIYVGDITRGKNQHQWEAILKSVTLGDMPPADKKQLSDEEKSAFLQWLQGGLDNYSAQNPNPGRSTIRRLNRSEYANSVRDLLALELDITEWLPGDDSGYGFDNNVDVLAVSTTLLERYLNVAGKVSRLAEYKKY